MIFGIEDNNLQKENIRFFLSNEIKNYFGRRKYSMLELLGSGIGAEFFLAKQKAMTKLTCVEYNIEKYSWWSSNKLHLLRDLYPEKRIESFNIDLYKFYFLIKEKNIKYDIINLDTMQYIGPKTYISKQKTVHEHLESIFNLNIISNRGLLLLNVMINGFRCVQGPYRNSICKDQNEIISFVAEIANKHGYTVDQSSSSGMAYKPGGKGWATMLHSVIPVTRKKNTNYLY